MPVIPHSSTTRTAVHDDLDADPRFTAGLLFDVLAVLDRHGYCLSSDEEGAYAGALVALLRLTRAYEGTGR
jgi:hypothetical protein